MTGAPTETGLVPDATDLARPSLGARLLGPPGPARRLVAAAAAESCGTGAFMAIALVFLTTKVGFAPVPVATALTVAGIASAVAGIWLGVVADLFGARRILVAALLLEGGSVAVVAFSRIFLLYATAIVMQALANRLAYGARGALMGKVFEQARAESRAHVRSAQNVGITVGAAIGGLALAVNSVWGYRYTILLYTAACVVSAGLARGLPFLQPRPRAAAEGRSSALVTVHRDKRFATISALHGVLCVNYALFEVAMPLWIIHETPAPHWTISVLLILNTTLVVLLQVRISSRADNLASGARSFQFGGVLLGLSAAAFFGAQSHSTGVAMAFLLAAGLFGVFGEMLHISGSWEVSYGLSPDDRNGEYQSAFSSAGAIGTLGAPLLAAGFVVRSGGWGWLVWGGISSAAAISAGALVRRWTAPHA